MIHPIWALIISFILITLGIVIIYIFDIKITSLQIIISVSIIFFTLFALASVFLINKLLKRDKSEHIDLESKSREFIKNWYRNLTGEELTYEEASFQQRHVGKGESGETFALWKIPRRDTGQFLGVIVGTKPKLYMAKWDWIINPGDLETLWKEISPIHPGSPSKYAGYEDSIYILKKQTPKEIIKETKETMTEWQKLKEGEKNENKS